MLSEQNRQKLDSIVSQMVNNKETDTDIQSVVNDFKSKYDESETVEPQDTSIMQKVGQLAGVMPSIPKQIAENPKQAGVTGAKALGQLGLYGAQAAGQMVLPGMAAAKFGVQGAAKLAPYLASGLTATPVTQFGIEKLGGATTPEAAKQAGIAGALDIGFGAAGGLAKAGLRKILPKTASFMAGIPEEATERALEAEKTGQSLFKGKFEPKETEKKLGAEAIETLQAMKRETGQQISAIKKQWKNLPEFEKTNIKNTAKNASIGISDLLESRKFGKKYDLDLATVKDLKQLSRNIKKVDNIGDLYTYIGDLDDLVSYDAATGLKKSTPRSEAAIKEARGIIRDELGKISPEYSDLADKYSEIANLNKSLLPKLKDKNIAGTQIKKIFNREITHPENTEKYIDELDKLDSILPNKPISKIKDSLIREKFENILPSGNMLSGIARGGALAGLGVYGQGNPALLAGAGALGAAMSPMTYKQLIKTTAATGPIKQTAAKQAFMRISDLLNNKGE